MSLLILYRDELKGFYKSNVMIILWIGMPLISVIAYFTLPKTDTATPVSLVASGIVSSVGGWLAAIMLAVHIIYEKSHHVYELFLIRPVHRSHIIISKFLAVITCVVSSLIISMLLSITVDYLFLQQHPATLFTDTLQSLIPAFSIIAMECAAGAFVGALVSSALVGIILVVITHNLSALAILAPIMWHVPHTTLLSAATGMGITSVFLYLAISIFQRRQF
jgi:ABC-2 type transport system permease protein